jgi:hypothetical protein
MLGGDSRLTVCLCPFSKIRVKCVPSGSRLSWASWYLASQRRLYSMMCSLEVLGLTAMVG